LEMPGGGAAASGADEALQQSPYEHVAAESVRPKHTHKRPRKGVRDPLAPHGYTTSGPIASGAFATVAKAVHRLTSKEVAVKSFLKKRKSTTTPGERALGMTRTVEDGVVKGTRELEVLRLLAAQSSLHPGVAHLLEVVESSRAVHAVLEYCAGGSLSFLLSSRPVCSGLEEEQAAGLFAQACRAYRSTTTCCAVLLHS
jgi:serine/threonine protein kinase